MNELISGADYKALLPFRAGPLSVDAADQRMKHLIDENYLEPSEYRTEWYTDDEIITVPVSYRLSIKGIDALEMYEKVQKQSTSNEAEKAYNNKKSMADNVKQRKQNWYIAIFGAVVTIVLFLLEHFSAILAFIKSVFHK